MSSLQSCMSCCRSACFLSRALPGSQLVAILLTVTGCAHQSMKSSLLCWHLHLLDLLLHVSVLLMLTNAQRCCCRCSSNFLIQGNIRTIQFKVMKRAELDPAFPVLGPKAHENCNPKAFLTAIMGAMVALPVRDVLACMKHMLFASLPAFTQAATHPAKSS